MISEEELRRFSREELIVQVQRLQHEKLTLLHEHGNKMKVGLHQYNLMDIIIRVSYHFDSDCITDGVKSSCC